MNIFKKSDVKDSKNTELFEMISDYMLLKNRLEKKESLGGVFLFICVFIICFNIFLTLTNSYFLILNFLIIPLFYVLFSWNKHLDKNKEYLFEKIILLIKKEQDLILKKLCKKVESFHLKLIFDKILKKIANNQHDDFLIEELNEFAKEYMKHEKHTIEESKADELKQMYKISLKDRDLYEINLDIKEKYAEMC